MAKDCGSGGSAALSSGEERSEPAKLKEPLRDEAAEDDADDPTDDVGDDVSFPESVGDSARAGSAMDSEPDVSDASAAGSIVFFSSSASLTSMA